MFAGEARPETRFRVEVLLGEHTLEDHLGAAQIVFFAGVEQRVSIIARLAQQVRAAAADVAVLGMLEEYQTRRFVEMIVTPPARDVV